MDFYRSRYTLKLHFSARLFRFSTNVNRPAEFCDQAQQNRQLVQKSDPVDDVVSEVKQMSLESIDMTPPAVSMTTVVPGYEFTPDPALWAAGDFQNPLTATLQDQFFDNGANDPFDPGNFQAIADADAWFGLTEPDHSTVDLSDLIVFQGH